MMMMMTLKKHIERIDNLRLTMQNLGWGRKGKKNVVRIGVVELCFVVGDCEGGGFLVVFGTMLPFVQIECLGDGVKFPMSKYVQWALIGGAYYRAVEFVACLRGEKCSRSKCSDIFCQRSTFVPVWGVGVCGLVSSSLVSSIFSVSSLVYGSISVPLCPFFLRSGIVFPSSFSS